MKHLIVTEAFESIRIKENDDKTLSIKEVDELESYIKANKLQSNLIKITRHNVTFINYVGYIQLQTCSIEILPKISSGDEKNSRLALLNMLAKTGYIDVNYSDLASLTNKKISLYEILGWLFAESLKKELIRGRENQYTQQQEDLAFIRGKIDSNKLIRNKCLNNFKIHCIYEEYSPNHLLNQIFKKAIRLLIRRIRFNETIKALNFCLVNLDGVDDVEINLADLEKIHFHRQNIRYNKSFVLAKLLLQSMAGTSRSGYASTFSVLFRMEILYEEYIAYLCKCYVSSSIKKQDKRYKLLIKESTDRGSYNLIPDLVVYEEGDGKTIIDTKWKIIDDASNRYGISREDFFQMYAYLTRYKSAHTAILLYPYDSELNIKPGECVESWYLEDAPEKKLKVYTVEYENETKAIEQLKRMIEDVSQERLGAGVSG